MAVDKVLLVLDTLSKLPWVEIVEGLSRTYGFIHKKVVAELDGTKGFLIWDFVVWNEITFAEDAKDGKIISFFTSISDKETEDKWNELVALYGVPK